MVIGYLAAVLIGLSVAFVAVGLSRRTTSGVAALTRAGVGGPVSAAPTIDRDPGLGARLSLIHI